MAEAESRVKLSYNDYCKTSDECWEHLSGELVTAPSPKRSYQRASFKLSGMLGDFVDRMGLGEVSVSPFDVVLCDTNVVQPDILFVSKSRRHISTQNNIQGAPDLVIEVLSPSNASRDWSTKRSMY